MSVVSKIMNNVMLICMLPLLGLSLPVQAEEHQSEYVGQESRAVKSLSDEEIAAFKHGKGFGFAKAAELNGYPGPKHVLDLAKELSLTDEQLEKTQQLFLAMQKEAIDKGEQLIQAEVVLDRAFSARDVTSESLRDQTEIIAGLKAELRFIHLNAHLAQTDLLSAEQIALYNKLRGYLAGSLQHNHKHH